MSTTTQISAYPTTTTVTETPRPLWKPGVVAAVLAAVATTSAAAVASAAGVSFADSTGKGVPLAAFAQLTIVFSMIGVGMATVMARRAIRPQSTFIRTSVTLTLLSFVPDLTFGFDAASAATLIGLHTIAAGIVVPTLARRLTNSSGR